MIATIAKISAIVEYEAPHYRDRGIMLDRIYMELEMRNGKDFNTFDCPKNTLNALNLSVGDLVVLSMDGRDGINRISGKVKEDSSGN